MHHAINYKALVGNRVKPPWVEQNGGLYTNSRSMPLNGLMPGTQYQVQVRSIGGSTGYSAWSDTVSHKSM